MFAMCACLCVCLWTHACQYQVSVLSFHFETGFFHLPQASWPLRVYRPSFYRWCSDYLPPHLSSCAFWGSNLDAHASTLRTSDWPCFSRLTICFHLIRPLSYSVRTIPCSSSSSLPRCCPYPFCYSPTNAHVSTTSLMTLKFKWVLQIY